MKHCKHLQVQDVTPGTEMSSTTLTTNTSATKTRSIPASCSGSAPVPAARNIKKVTTNDLQDPLVLRTL